MSDKLVTILMVAFNHLDLTKKAIQSLFECTNKEHYKLVFINNGSFDDTCGWAYQNLDKYCDDFKIRNRNNDGWIKAINEEIDKIDTPYFVTCHNDILFEKDWLPKMVKRFDDNDKIAMVGPTSDFILGLQSNQFNQRGIVSENAKFICGLFCMFKKSAIDELIEKDGFFMDPIFGMGDKEELDYAIRLSNLGYSFRIARNVFIHHDGEKGFVDKLGSREAFHEYQNQKYEILVNKWNEKIVTDLYTIKMNERLNVCICVPMRNRYVHNKFVASLMTLLKPGVGQYIDCIGGVIHESRNLLVEKALELSGTHILFIDDDMEFDPESLIKLLEDDVDIVCGLAFHKVAPYDPVIYKLYENNGRIDILANEKIKQGLVEVDAIGSAFVLIRRQVFEKMERPWYKWGDKSLGIYTESGGLGEDISFSLHAKKQGFKVHCDTDLIITHLGFEERVTDKTYMNYKNSNPEVAKRVREVQ